MKKSRGFTAIELMLVICCIGILVAISLPAYQDYTIRSRLAEALVLAEPVRQAVRDYYDRWGAFPFDNAQAGLADANAWRGQHVQSIRIENGVVFISLASTIGPNLAGEELHLQPVVNAAHPTAAFAWRCEAAAVPEGFRLHASLDDAVFVIEKKYLPASCRF